MKDKLLKIGIKEIKTSFKRFLSLLIMSMLGVGVFVGISATSPDMTKSLDNYYDKTDTYDIKLLSTLGFSENTINELKDIKGTKSIIGTKSIDKLTSVKEKEFVVKYIEINNDINKIEIKQGRSPKKGEVLVEEKLLERLNLNIGDTLSIDENSSLKQSKFKIVGTVKSPLYIGNLTPAANRGNTTISSGRVDYYAYIDSSSFDMDYDTEVYITVTKAKKEITDSKNYLSFINKTTKDIKNNKSFIEESRYNELYNQGKKEIDKEKELNEQKLNTAYEKLSSTRQELSNGKRELDSKKEVLDSAEIQLLSAKKQLDETKNKLDLGNQELISSKQELDIAKEQIDQGIEEINQQVAPYITYDDIKNAKNIYDQFMENVPTKEDAISYIPDTVPYYNEIVSAINYIYDTDPNTIRTIITDPTVIDSIKAQIPTTVPYYDDIITGLDYYKTYSTEILDGIDKVNRLVDADNKYEEGINKYNEGQQEYNDGLNKYNEAYTKYLSSLNEYNAGKALYEEGLNSYYSGYNLYQKGLEEYARSRSLFDEKIRDAYKQLDSIEKCNLYTYTRLDDKDYSGYMEDGKSIANLAKVFPTIFFIVAVLISLISMSRMVEEDRIEIGTLKSLGFSNRHIRKKYLLYSFSATLLGGIIGSILGFYLLPYYIFGLYRLLFVIEDFSIYYDMHYIILGIIISLVCICGTTLLTVNKVVKEKPSDLMRPKAPKNGKRVLMERIGFIWKRLNFSKKVTIRNLFRYKKRVLMTIVGILGCTALMLTGFGIRDSIVDIPDEQYKKVLHFSDMIYVNQNNEGDIDKYFTSSNIKNYTKTYMLAGNVKNYNTNLFVPSNDSKLENTLSLRELSSKEKLSLSDGDIYISDKLAELANKKIGDIITFIDSNGKHYDLKITNIYENYAGNYILMNQNTYEKEFGKYTTNVVYVNLNDIKKETSWLKSLMAKKEVMSVISSKTTLKNVEDMLKTLDSVVLLLIILSGALSLVVLYNLAIININERTREIATLKVLGFTDKEVDNYINKETIIITIIGIVLGLICGVFLTSWMVKTVEVDMVRFINKINPISFIITALIILLFTLVVNIVTHFTLKKIDMIESLKSVE